VPVVENYVLAAIHNSRKIPQADVEAQFVSLRAHLDFLLSGAPNADVSWRSMADVSNVTETLSGMRIGSGPDAKRVILEARRALAEARERAKSRGSWAMRSEERQALREALEWLLSLHEIQMREASIREYSRAYDRTRAKTAAARKKATTTMVVGDL